MKPKLPNAPPIPLLLLLLLSLLLQPTTPQSTTVTQCIAGYTWNSAASMCYRNCTALANTVPINTGVDSCGCAVGYTWNSFTQSCEPVTAAVLCSGVSNSPGNSLGQFVCACNANYIWLNGQCLINCSLVVGAVPNTAGQVCVCTGGNQFSLVTFTCGSRSLSQFNNGVVPGVPVTTTTTSSTTTTTVVSGGGINCSIPNVISDPTNPAICRCRDGFFFDRQSCFRSCSLFNLQNDPLNPQVCVCQTGSVWNGASCVSSTTFIVDCSVVVGSRSRLNSTTCVCYEGYYWNGSTCLYNAASGIVRCKELANSAGYIQMGSGINTAECMCMSGYTWNATVRGCALTTTQRSGVLVGGTTTSINCTAIANTTGQGSDNVSCTCISSYNWNSSTNSCWIACSRISNSNNNLNATYCNCGSGYVWSNDSNSACIKDCSGVDSSNGTYNWSSGGCNCKFVSYQWNGSECELNCALASYTKDDKMKTKKKGKECHCKGGYKWDYHFHNCRSKTGSSGLGVGLGVGLGLGLPLAILSGVLYYYYKKKKSHSVQVPAVTPVMMQPVPPPTTTTIVTEQRLTGSTIPAYHPVPPPINMPPPSRVQSVASPGYVQYTREGPPIIVKEETRAVVGEPMITDRRLVGSRVYAPPNYSGDAYPHPGSALGASQAMGRGTSPQRR